MADEKAAPKREIARKPAPGEEVILSDGTKFSDAVDQIVEDTLKDLNATEDDED